MTTTDERKSKVLGEAWNVVETIGNEEAVRMSSAHSFFTEIVEIRILRNKPTDNNADQARIRR